MPALTRIAIPQAVAPLPAGRGRPPATAPEPEDGAAPADRVSVSAAARRLAGRPGALAPAEARLVAELARRDAEVRAHEAAHQAAGGALVGGASFTYQQGPDGKHYAIGGEVPISLREGRTPDETIAVARQIRRAALAPADPSSQDLAVAASAAAMEQAARTRKAREAARAYGELGAFSRSPAPGADPSAPASSARPEPFDSGASRLRSGQAKSRGAAPGYDSRPPPPLPPAM